MNKQRRKEIRNIIIEIERLQSKLESVQTEEEIAFDNMPENLQGSMRGEESEEAIETLQTANDLVQEAIDNLKDAVEELENI